VVNREQTSSFLLIFSVATYVRDAGVAGSDLLMQRAETQSIKDQAGLSCAVRNAPELAVDRDDRRFVEM
jgi:hypothetical protein